jgi:hypothetical protein
MCIQINNHGLSDQSIVEEHFNAHCHIGIDAKSTAFLSGCMMETATDVYSPTVMKSEPSSHDRTPGLESWTKK